MENLINARKIVERHYFENRPSWDIYFLNITIAISHRSEDPNIKHGAVIVDNRNHIIGTGYNAFISGGDKNIIPVYNREEKRKWVIHAEENALLNCSSLNKDNCKIYITGEPCNNCLQRIINFGIRDIVIIDRVGSITENDETRNMKNLILEMSKVNIKRIPLKDLFLT